MTKKAHKNKDKKIFSLSIQDLKDLGIIKSKKKRKNKRNKKSSGYEMGGMKSTNNHMVGYSNTFNPATNVRNDTEYQVNKLLETKGIRPDNLRTNKIDVPLITNGYDNDDDDRIRPKKYITIEEGKEMYEWADKMFKNIRGNNNITIDDDDNDNNDDYITNYDYYDNNVDNKMFSPDEDDINKNNNKMYNRSDGNGIGAATGGSEYFRRDGEPANQIDEIYKTPTKKLLPYFSDDGVLWTDNPLTNKKQNLSTPQIQTPSTPRKTPKPPPIQPDIIVEDVEEERPKPNNKTIDITNEPETPKPNNKIIDITNEPEPPKPPLLTRKQLKDAFDNYNSVDIKGKKRTKAETVEVYKQFKNLLGEPIEKDDLDIKHPAQLNSINRELGFRLKEKYKLQKK